jgi:hypothetical protein
VPKFAPFRLLEKIDNKLIAAVLFEGKRNST